MHFSYRDLHDWNRRKAALDTADKAAQELGEDSTLLQDKFQIMSINEEIPLDKVQKECGADPKVGTALHGLNIEKLPYAATHSYGQLEQAL